MNHSGTEVYGSFSQRNHNNHNQRFQDLESWTGREPATNRLPLDLSGGIND